MGEDRAQFLLSVGGVDRGDSFASLESLVWLVALIFASTILFAELHNVLNSIWQVESQLGWKEFFYSRLLALGTVLALIFLFLFSVLINTTLVAVRQFFLDYLPAQPVLLPFITSLVVFIVMTCWFALMFKFLPEIRIAWGDVWGGAVLASLLFVLGSYLIGLYLGLTRVGSFYGAAGSLVMVLLWLYYSLQVFLFGAEFTKVYARHSGSLANRAT